MDFHGSLAPSKPGQTTALSRDIPTPKSSVIYGAFSPQRKEKEADKRQDKRGPATSEWVRGLSCPLGPVSYLCGPADLEQVEPVGVPVVDDVGQFPPLLLPAPRHGGQQQRRFLTLSVRYVLV